MIIRKDNNINQSAKRILLVSNKVMHYRVPIYNYFYRRFHEAGYEFSVIADSLQKQNQRPLEFIYQEIAPSYLAYSKAIINTEPAAVILFLHLKNWILWPIIHWLKMRGIPFAFWTKGGNWDAKDDRFRYHLFNYIHGLSDGLIVYSKECLKFIKPRFHSKAFVANNTIHFDDFPSINNTKDDIKREFKIPFKKVVLFVGRMEEGKGRKRVDHLIEIFSEVKREDIGLVVVGSGLSEELRARMNPQTTIYLGEVHDAHNIGISKLFKMSDVCAIPGHVGLGLNQAFYWGLPVVTEEGEHPPEIAYLKPGHNGFIVPRNDLQSLKERILFLLDHDDVRAEFSRNARKSILAEASTEVMFRGFSDCIQYLISRR